MKHFLLLPLASLGFLSSSDVADKAVTVSTVVEKNLPAAVNSNNDAGYKKMSAVVFRSQEFCRAELPFDFEFDAKFSIAGATVYFSGTNFKSPEKGTITSSSLKPLANMMKRCAPGTTVVFEDVKVKDPLGRIRPIEPLMIQLF